MILSGSPKGALAIMGIECSTFVAINRGTSQRSQFMPYGNIHAPSVAAANMATSRQQLPNPFALESFLQFHISCMAHMHCLQDNAVAGTPHESRPRMVPGEPWVVGYWLLSTIPMVGPDAEGKWDSSYSFWGFRMECLKMCSPIVQTVR